MLVVDGGGVPLGLRLAAANVGETKLAEPTLATISVGQARGRSRTRPEHLIADKGFDSRHFRDYLHRRGIRHTIARIRRPAAWKKHRSPRPIDQRRYQDRWIVERSMAWLKNFRRVMTRLDRDLSCYRAFVLLACLMVALNAFLK